MGKEQSIIINLQGGQTMKAQKLLEEAVQQLLKKIDGMMLRYKNGYLEPERSKS